MLFLQATVLLSRLLNLNVVVFVDGNDKKNDKKGEVGGASL